MCLGDEGIPVMCDGELGWRVGSGGSRANATLLLDVLIYHAVMGEAQRLKNTCE